MHFLCFYSDPAVMKTRLIQETSSPDDCIQERDKGFVFSTTFAVKPDFEILKTSEIWETFYHLGDYRIVKVYRTMSQSGSVNKVLSIRWIW